MHALKECEIIKGIKIVGEALWVEEESVIIISDLHLGYEEHLYNKGVMVPKLQLQEVISKISAVLKKIKKKPKKLVINGDLKHEFGKALKQEWKDVLALLDFLSGKVCRLVIVKGNHDSIIPMITGEKKIDVVKKQIIKDIAITHGDALIRLEGEDGKSSKNKIKTIIIGHEHPAIKIRHKGKSEMYKCFLKGKWGEKELLVMPSFNPLLEGTDIMSGVFLGPYLSDISEFDVFVSGESSPFWFGKVADLNFEKGRAAAQF